jgi:hypothetical protein
MAVLFISNPTAPGLALPSAAALNGSEIFAADQTVSGTLKTVGASIAQIATYITGGGGFISSIVGTANEIAVSVVAGVATLSFSPNIVIPAPPSGNTLTINTFAGAIGLNVNGAANNWAAQINGLNSAGQSFGLLINSGTSAGDYAMYVQNAAASAVYMKIFGDGHGLLGPTSSLGLSWATTGAMSMVSSSGIALTVTGSNTSSPALEVLGVGSGNSILANSGVTVGSAFGPLFRGGSNGSDYALTVQNYNASATFFQLYGDGTGKLGNQSASTQLSWTNACNFTIGQPATGYPLVLGSSANGFGLAVLNGQWSFTEGQYISAGFAELISSNTTSIYIGTNQNTAVNLCTQSVSRFQADGVGNISITARATVIAVPTANVAALTVNGYSATGQNALVVQGANFAGARGMTILGGTSVNDFCLITTNAVNAANFLLVYGDGSVTCGPAPTGGGLGNGTVNVSGGYYINSNQLFFGVPPSSNTTAALTDVGKVIVATGNIAINNSVFVQGSAFSIYNNSASAITINGTVTTMRLAGTATTGNRTLAARGMATVWMNSATEAIVGGPGVT